MLLIQAIFLFWAFCPLAVIAGVINTTPSNNLDTRKKTGKNSSSSDRKSKRLVDDQTATLLHAGVLLADYPLFDYGDSILQSYGQYNQTGTYYQQHGTSALHQEEAPLVASRHPTKPVYHYTPLPQGTFPAKTIPDEEEKEDNNRPGNNEYWYDYLVRDGAQGLDLGQREARQGGLVRGGYHVLLPDRRTQLVQYWSDWSGYHPTVTYSYT